MRKFILPMRRRVARLPARCEREKFSRLFFLLFLFPFPFIAHRTIRFGFRFGGAPPAALRVRCWLLIDCLVVSGLWPLTSGRLTDTDLHASLQRTQHRKFLLPPPPPALALSLSTPHARLCTSTYSRLFPTTIQLTTNTPIDHHGPNSIPSKN
jgi:hypothetical protein